MKEIFGSVTSEFKYYWVDEMENPRGYANSKEECVAMAEEKCCTIYTILENH